MNSGAPFPLCGVLFAITAFLSTLGATADDFSVADGSVAESSGFDGSGFDGSGFDGSDVVESTGDSILPASWSAEEDLAARLSRLEAAWQARDAADLKKAADAKKKPTFKIGGRIHADWWQFPETDPGIGFFEHPDNTAPDFGQDPEAAFAFRRIRVEMSGDVMESGFWRMQIDFNNPQTPEIKDVYIGFKDLIHNQRMIIGNHKRPLGLDHLNSSRFNVFIERPFVVEAFNEDARRPGISIRGVTEDEVFNWQYGAYYLESTPTDGRYIGDARQMSLNARLATTPWYEEDGESYVHFAMSGMAGHPDGFPATGSTNVDEGRFRTRPEARSQSRWLNTGRIPGAEWYEVLGWETVFNQGPLQITGEIQANWLQRSGVAPGVPRDLFFHGAYVYIGYFLTGEHIPFSRSSGTLGRVKPHSVFKPFHRWHDDCESGIGAWQIAARYSYLDVSDGDILGGVGESLTLAVNWHFTAYSRLQFNAIHGEIEDHAPIGGFTDGNYWILGTRLAVDF